MTRFSKEKQLVSGSLIRSISKMSNVTISKAAPILPYFHLRAVSFVYLLAYEMNATPPFIHPSLLAPVLLFHKTWDNNSQNDQGRNSALRWPLVKCAVKKRRSEGGRVFGDNQKCAIAATFDRSACWKLTIVFWMFCFFHGTCYSEKMDRIMASAPVSVDHAPPFFNFLCNVRFNAKLST